MSAKVITFDYAAFRAKYITLLPPRTRLTTRHFYDRRYTEWSTLEFMQKRRSSEHMGFAQGMGIDNFTIPLSITVRIVFKQCLKCDSYLPLSEFSRDKRMASGRHSYCKDCRAESARRKWKANRGAA